MRYRVVIPQAGMDKGKVLDWGRSTVKAYSRQLGVKASDWLMPEEMGATHWTERPKIELKKLPKGRDPLDPLEGDDIKALEKALDLAIQGRQRTQEALQEAQQRYTSERTRLSLIGATANDKQNMERSLKAINRISKELEGWEAKEVSAQRRLSTAQPGDPGDDRRQQLKELVWKLAQLSLLPSFELRPESRGRITWTHGPEAHSILDEWWKVAGAYTGLDPIREYKRILAREDIEALIEWCRLEVVKE